MSWRVVLQPVGTACKTFRNQYSQQPKCSQVDLLRSKFGLNSSILHPSPFLSASRAFSSMNSKSQAAASPSLATQPQNQRPKSEAVPYKGPPLPNVVEDLIVPNILPTPLPSFSTVDADERLWVPQAPDIDFRPLIFSVSQGYFVNLLRVRRCGILSRHRHTGPVHAVTLKGRWHYLEHPWWANEGGYSYEPSGDIHTLEVPDGVDEMITLFHVTGAYVYVDPEGNALGIEDVFSKLQSAREHYERVGLGANFADQYIR